MPELPDVELARRRLRRWLLGAEVSAADCRDARLTRPASAGLFARTVVGKTVKEVARRGKWLRLELDDGARVFSHLGMTGDWARVAVDAPALRFERARIDVVRRGRASSVRYVDARRFGRLIGAQEDIADWSALGPDPLADGVDEVVLSRELAKRRRGVKEILMDQRVVAGVGNILATEALWMARVDPRTPGNALLPADVRAIARGLGRAIARELAEGRGCGGGEHGSFFVYGRAGEPCPRCGTRIRSLVLGGRTSAFCAHCQVRRRSTRKPLRESGS
jgi:formamidopyrimidine-DNA glycosylase